MKLHKVYKLYLVKIHMPIRKPGSLNNYRRGRAKEYYNMNKMKKKGFDIVLRSAGSHSPIDILGINFKDKRIRFIQNKPRSMSENAKKKIEEANVKLNDEFICSFEVI